MTPMQKLRHLILIAHASMENAEVPTPLTGDDVDELWDTACENDDGGFQDAKYEFREGEVETKIPCEWSRHYESKSVAAKAPDGSWVGWTFWYGGGKHSEPEAINWIEHAYDLHCAEEQKMVTIQTFTKVPA